MQNLPSDELLATTLRAIGDGVISCDQKGCVVLMNGEAERLTGWTQAQASGRPLREVFVIVNEVTRETAEDPVEKVFRMGAIVGMANHTLLIRPDQTDIAIDDSASPIYDEGNTLRGVVLIFRDVTERRRAEWNLELLSGSGKILGQVRQQRGILERMGGLISQHFADACVFDLLQPTGELLRTVGKHRVADRQSVVDRLRQFIPARSDINSAVRTVISSGESLRVPNCDDTFAKSAAINLDHLEYLRKDLRCRSLLTVSIGASNEVLGALTFIRDTLAAPFDDFDRIAGEELAARLGIALRYTSIRERLAEERARLDAIVASVPVGVLVADQDGKILLGNSELDRVFGRSLKRSDAITEYAMHADGRPLRADEYPMARAIQSRETIRGEELLYQRGDGSKSWISISSAPVVNADGRLLGGVVAVADIDEQKKARELLRRSEERFRLLVERSTVGINIGDENGKLSYVNPTLLKLIGYTEEEVKRGEVRWDQLTAPQYAEADRTALEQLRTIGSAQPYEIAYRAKDGHLVPMMLGAVMIPGLKARDNADDIAIFFTDLTAQKRAEAALLQSEKLAAVGKLAASISHEINNPLAAVTNILFLIRNDATLSQQTRDYLETADHELARVSQVTAHTLRFHRQSTSAMSIRPDGLVEEVLGLYSTRLANSNIQVVRDYSSGVQVNCHEGDIRQVLNNLISNAFDAMRVGGRLTIRTRNGTRWSTGEKGIRISIADTGWGMTPKTLENLFQAFYTTKGNAGTGLGLWISSRIVHKHNGYIRAYSSKDARLHGSVFILWLPHSLASSANEPWHLEGGRPV